jgi:hypothetical protein
MPSQDNSNAGDDVLDAFLNAFPSSVDSAESRPTPPPLACVSTASIGELRAMFVDVYTTCKNTSRNVEGITSTVNAHTNTIANVCREFNQVVGSANCFTEEIVRLRTVIKELQQEIRALKGSWNSTHLTHASSSSTSALAMNAFLAQSTPSGLLDFSMYGGPNSNTGASSILDTSGMNMFAPPLFLGTDTGAD